MSVQKRNEKIINENKKEGKNNTSNNNEKEEVTENRDRSFVNVSESVNESDGNRIKESNIFTGRCRRNEEKLVI